MSRCTAPGGSQTPSAEGVATKRFGCVGCLVGVGVIAIVVLAVGLYLRSTYNGFVDKSQSTDAQWAQVETQFQRRYDLIPNLVESVKGIFEQEKDVFGRLADARARYGGAATPNDRAEAATQLESALGRLLVVVENYPQIASQRNVTQLMDELAGTENRIAVERARYNERVLAYNNAVKKFPSNMLASTFGYDERAYFRAASGAADGAPTVRF